MVGGSLRRKYRRRRNWRLVAVALLTTVVGLGLMGRWRIQPYVTNGGGRVQAARAAEALSTVKSLKGAKPLFDDSLVHSLSVAFSPGEYDDMMANFKTLTEKDYLDATIVIDGTTIHNVGVRLKGNSTLMTLSGRGPGGAIGIGAPPAGFAGGSGTTLSADKPEGLPWLIKFDHFVDNQRYQGFDEIAVRPTSGFGASRTVQNEALALRAIAKSGEPAQRSAYTTFTVNGSEQHLRLLVESPGKQFAEDVLGLDGVLYKGKASGRFAYLGEDPALYDKAYAQATRVHDYDLKPMISLVKWVTDATDADFDAHLADYVDVESLAKYAALHNLLLDFDDMAGPGNNGFYWYDLSTGRFQVVSWDLNLAFTSASDAGPLDTLGTGGLFGGGGFGGAPGGAGPGGPGPAGAGGIPGGAGPGGAGPGGAGQGGPGGIPGLQMGNPLKDRFLKSERFRPVYLAAYETIFKLLFADHWLETELTRLGHVLTTSGAADPATVTSEAQTIRTAIVARAKALPAKIVAARTPTVAAAKSSVETSGTNASPSTTAISLDAGVLQPSGSLARPQPLDTPPGGTPPGGSTGVPAPSGFQPLAGGMPAPGSPLFRWGGCLFQNGGNPISLAAGQPPDEANTKAIALCKDLQPPDIIIPG